MPTTTLLRIIASMLLFIALLHLPIGYYTFMRIAVTGIAIYNAFETRGETNRLWFIFFIAAAIVFNPILPIYLGNKHAWMPIDMAFGIGFLVPVFRGKP